MATKSLVIAFSFAVLALLPGGCSELSKPQGEEMAPPALTGQDAKSALIAMLRANPKFELSNGHIEPDRLAQAAIEEGEEACVIGPFWINLNQNEYSFTYGKKCRFRYQGSFQWKDGNWIASSPECKSVACTK